MTPAYSVSGKLTACISADKGSFSLDTERRIMNRVEFEKVLGMLQAAELKINQTKGREYAQGDEDALRNFKEAARFLGLTPLQVCGVYMYKHFASVISYATDGQSLSEESLEGRIADLRLYAALFLGLVLDQEGQ